MNIGIAQFDITPDRAIDLSGFAARTQPSTGVLDPIFVKCIYLQDGPQQLLWLHADLIALSPGFVNDFRAWAQSSLGIDTDHVLLSATHTHAAPATMTLIGCGQTDATYLKELTANCHLTAKAAVARTQACRMAFGSEQLNLAIDRRKKPTAHTDPAVSTLTFYSTDGRALASIVNYTMHPVTLGHVNRQVSADWCGAAASHISSALPGHPIVLVTNGAAGNINPPGENIPPEQVYSCGKAVGVAATAAILRTGPPGPSAERGETASLQVVSKIISIDLDVPDSASIDRITQHYLETLEPGSAWEKPFRNALLHWRESRKRELAAGLRSVDIELQVLRLGPATIVVVNGEMFSRFTQLVREKTRQTLFTVAYANAAFGYIPTDAAYDEGGYEVETAHFFYNSFRPKRGTLELLADRAAEMIMEATRA